MDDPSTPEAGYRSTKVIAHHVHLRPTLDGSRVVDVTMDLSADQLHAGAHAVRHVADSRYRLTRIESADDVLAMRELTTLSDELASLVVPGAIARLTLDVGGTRRLLVALEEFIAGATDEDAIAREGDKDALTHVFSMVDGVADAHAAAVRVALDDSVATGR
jgi:hypothetical protein